MRRTPSSIALAFVLLTAALTPRAAVFAQAPDTACDLDRTTRELLVEAVDVIVVARVEVDAGGAVSLDPEAYLKGPAAGGRIRLDAPADPPCEPGALPDGARVLVLLTAADGRFAWPAAPETYLLGEGRAGNGDDEPEVIPEADLVEEFRDLTGQYAVPAGAGDEGASIEWVGTVLPVGLGLLAILAVSLVMLREWHRIDPS